VIGAIKRGEVIAIKILEGSMKGDDFEAFIKIDLAPKLEVGEVVVMDNLNSHHRPEVAASIESVGASVAYLPTYSPEFNTL
jgi:transposase